MRTASTAKITKNTGIMTLFVFSMLFAPYKSVSVVPTATTTWNGTTENDDCENDANHSDASAVISVPTSESVSALSTYATITA